MSLMLCSPLAFGSSWTLLYKDGFDCVCYLDLDHKKLFLITLQHPHDPMHIFIELQFHKCLKCLPFVFCLLAMIFSYGNPLSSMQLFRFNINKKLMS